MGGALVIPLCGGGRVIPRLLLLLRLLCYVKANDCKFMIHQLCRSLSTALMMMMMMVVEQQNNPECNHSPESDYVYVCTLYNVQEDVKGITIRESVSYVVTLSTGKNIL